MNDLINKLIKAGIAEVEAKKEIQILCEELQNDQQKIEELVLERINSRTPIQYLLGKAWFMDFEVLVDKNVLIPRPETEQLVELTIERLHKNNLLQMKTDNGKQNIERPVSILDIGTGSGVIPIALAKANNAIQCSAFDISQEAINMAKKNAELNGVKDQVNFMTCDIFSSDFEKLIQENSFDLIISNPPYVKDEGSYMINEEKDPELLHEPKVALHGSKENKTGLIYYERILEVCSSSLLSLEVDPEVIEGLKSLLKKYDISNYKIKKDFSGNDRYLLIN